MTSRPGPPEGRQRSVHRGRDRADARPAARRVRRPDVDDDDQPVRHQRGVLPADHRRRSAGRQDSADGPDARQHRARRLQRAELEHGPDLQRHLLADQPALWGTADALPPEVSPARGLCPGLGCVGAVGSVVSGWNRRTSRRAPRGLITGELWSSPLERRRVYNARLTIATTRRFRVADHAWTDVTTGATI